MKLQCPDCDFTTDESEVDNHTTCNGGDWITVDNWNISKVVIDKRLLQARVHEVRTKQPEICWRPRGDWETVCILNFGHNGPCGWEINQFS